MERLITEELYKLNSNTELFEIANISPGRTGLSFDIWIGSAGKIKESRSPMK